MPRRVPADLENALAATPAARDRFWSLPPEQVDAWVRYVERGRFPGARRRRIGQTVRRLSGRPRVRTTVATNGNAPVVAAPRDEWLVWLLGALVAAGVIALILWLAFFRNDNSNKPGAVVVGARSTVPHVVGIRVQAAEFQLKQAKLSSKVVLRPARKSRGIVVGQAPKTGEHVPQGTTVKLLVSNGPPGVKVVRVVGLAAADAVQRLDAQNLNAVLRQVTGTKSPGTVIGQRPAAGIRAKTGSTVVLEVVKGKPSVAVPNFVGRSESEAVAGLRRDGLTSHVVRVPASQPSGRVIAQNPPAGQNVAQGSLVRLNVSKGPAKPATTPTTTASRATTTTAAAPPPAKPSGPYGGRSLNAAVQQIAQGRRQAIVVYQASSLPLGSVISSSNAGSRVRLNVSGGKALAPTTSVPDVTGEDKATAVSDLENAGFTVLQVKWPVSDQASDNVVVAQTPVTSAPQGSAIVIYYGSATG